MKKLKYIMSLFIIVLLFSNAEAQTDSLSSYRTETFDLTYHKIKSTDSAKTGSYINVSDSIEVEGLSRLSFIGDSIIATGGGKRYVLSLNDVDQLGFLSERGSYWKGAAIGAGVGVLAGLLLGHIADESSTGHPKIVIPAGLFLAPLGLILGGVIGGAITAGYEDYSIYRFPYKDTEIKRRELIKALKKHKK